MKISRFHIFPIAIIVVILDQIIKIWISNTLQYAQEISLIKNILSITKVYNTGAAFSLLENSTVFLSVVSIFAIIAISYYFIRKLKSINLYLITAWGLILGGTTGNLIDRLWHGYVIDFIKLDFIRFPIFNFADVAINIGTFILLLYILIDRESKEENVEQNG